MNLLLVLFWILGGVSLGVIGLIYGLNYFPKEKEEGIIRKRGSSSRCLSLNDEVKIVSWNIQYCASTQYQFFYEEGTDVFADKKVVLATLEGIASTLQKIDADLVLLQEVDLKSKRSGDVNQFELLQDQTGYPFASYVCQWKSHYYPGPTESPLKNIDSGIVVLSKYPIDTSLRHRLPPIESMSLIERAFYLKRAIQEIEIPLSEGGGFALMNTHLDAFSSGDNTLQNQVQVLDTLLKEKEAQGKPYLVAGDFNLLPPTVDPRTITFGGEFYPPSDRNPIHILMENHKAALDLGAYGKNPGKYNTYIPPKYEQADRWLDHVFMDPKIDVIDYSVLSDLTRDLSDHHPISITIKLPLKAPEEEIEGS